MTDSTREYEYNRLFGPEGNKFTIVGEYADGTLEDLDVNGTFDEIQQYLDEKREDLFNIFYGVHIKRVIDDMNVEDIFTK
jgi:hypothetical protein